MVLNIVIPVLNEENSLQFGVETTINYLNQTNLRNRFIITIADNGSTDRTAEIAQNLCNIHNNLYYFKVSERGVGLAFREAIKRNTCDIVGYMDVDLATDIKHLPQVYLQFAEKNKKIVVGSRLLKKSRVYNRTLLREITSRSLNLILKLLLRVHFSDAMCGFKFYDKNTADYLIGICSNNPGWFYCAEMMIRAEWENIPVFEIPVHWTDAPDSKVKIGKLSMDYLSDILKLYKIKKEKKI